MEYFPDISSVRFKGQDTNELLAYRYYNPDEILAGKTMQEHLRMSVCFWHSFCWNGRDIFGADTFQRPWISAEPSLEFEKQKVDAAFELISKLGLPFYCFHDVDVIPPAESPRLFSENLEKMTDYLGEKMSRTNVRLLWGTANLFGHPRYIHGAATSSDPGVFAWAAHQVCRAMMATKALDGANYVLWGGREGYETLLNTDLRRERQQLGRFMQMVVEHKHAIGFKGTLLIEPKPQEPTKHQYDYDVAAVHSFLQEFDLVGEMKVNIEVNHATLAGHSFHHEVASALALGIFGSVDANRGDPQLGWDTDQFPTKVEDLTMPLFEILRHGGFESGGFNFDARVRRASTDRRDLVLGHVGGIDTLALALRKAVKMLEDGALQRSRDARYESWESEFGRSVLAERASLAQLSERVVTEDLRPLPGSGGQEHLELLVNRCVHS